MLTIAKKTRDLVLFGIAIRDSRFALANCGVLNSARRLRYEAEIIGQEG
jgi:hypothetical protein